MLARFAIAIGIGVLLVVGWVLLRGSDEPVKPASAKSTRPDASYPMKVRRIDRETRARMVEGLAKLRDASSESAPKPAPSGRAERRYIRAAMKEIVPLLTGCYERNLLRDASLAGTVIVEFTIEGEPSVGGLVGDATISDESTLQDAQLRECIQETLFAIRIEPPAGGQIHVRYPFVFGPPR